MMAASAQKTRPAKVALRLLGQGNAHSGSYGPFPTERNHTGLIRRLTQKDSQRRKRSFRLPRIFPH